MVRNSLKAFTGLANPQGGGERELTRPVGHLIFLDERAGQVCHLNARDFPSSLLAVCAKTAHNAKMFLKVSDPHGVPKDSTSTQADLTEPMGRPVRQVTQAAVVARRRRAQRHPLVNWLVVFLILRLQQ